MLRKVARASLRARTMPIRSPPSRVMPALSIATSAPVPIGNPDIGGGQRGGGGGVVHAVARHGDLLAVAAQLLDQVLLGFGQDARAHLVDAELTCHLLAPCAHCPPVAMITRSP